MLQIQTHMSRGYTSALAMTAPVAPASANPHGGIKTSFDCPAIATLPRSFSSLRCVQDGDPEAMTIVGERGLEVLKKHAQRAKQQNIKEKEAQDVRYGKEMYAQSEDWKR